MTQENEVYVAPPLPPEPELTPKNLGDILGGMFVIYGRGFLKFVIPLAVINLVMVLFTEAYFPYDRILTVTRNLSIGPMLGMLALYLFLYLLAYSSLVHTAASYNVMGRHNLNHSFITAWKRLARIFGVIGLYLVVGLVGGLVLAMMMIIPILGIIVFIVVFPVLIWISIKLSFVFPAVIIEGVDPVKAFSRSWELVTGNWWRIFGITLLIGLITAAISWIIGLIFSFLGAYASVVSGALTGPFAIISLTLMYYDLRARNEHCTFVQAAAELDPTGNVSPPAPGGVNIVNPS